MQTITFWEVLENADKVEGKGSMVGTGIAFPSKEAAVAFASSKHYKPYAVMGIINKEYAMYDVKEKCITIFSSMEDFENNFEAHKKEVIRQRAINKLTKEERDALGITF